jgi:hypothetical protein
VRKREMEKIKNLERKKERKKYNKMEIKSSKSNCEV